ncbi:glycosyltransferase [Candidatus Methylopumilus universalis]|jgi:lipopolysaccharide biosynthesis glycosyltransferase|uniref:glycosyltransferase n=1 Tax=Candidatus Methylopumilus universalis TaxID=2588536 RepID=UPI00112028E3|nr:glycosyltransferase [Candidatus Methylopumilus universalis]QDC89731.1 glycosyltransferase [Candidatus Methylopumilus universalis]QDC91032.1 glycosyltransferase [Candidatus Methylopumilus universalis]
MNEIIKIVVGFDQRESVAYHTFCQSVIENASIPVSFIPLAINNLKNYKETHTDQSNDFIYSRFLAPYLNNFEGWAIFADGDMICQSDIKELWNLKDPSKALMVVKHDYETKAHTKYLGNKNENYPRKNWSSLILWNCSHPKHKILTPEFIQNQTGKYLHRFSWLNDYEIGDLPKEWNWLAIEYPENNEAKLIHYTLGTPCFKEYENTDMADIWYNTYKRVKDGIGK